MSLHRHATAVIALCFALGTIAFLPPPAGARVSADANGFAFALIGDMPYGAEGNLKYPNVIADINADRKLAFVVHDGDIKNGSSLCSDEMYAERLDLFNSFLHPLIYVPGDNEWTDCHRANNGADHLLERLALLRSLFYPDQQSLGQRTTALKRQSADPAYAAYPGERDPDDEGSRLCGPARRGQQQQPRPDAVCDAEDVARNGATLDWLRKAFVLARLARARAVMLVIQANPGFD